MASGLSRSASGVAGFLHSEQMPALSFSRIVLVAATASLGLSAGVVACTPTRDAGSAATTAATLVDDFGDTTRIGAPRTRIVSLNPSTTEVLFAIGAGGRVVGRTTWDLWPDSARLVPDLGDALRPNIEAVLAARPDLVLLYAREDNRAAAHAFRRAGIATLSLRNDRIADFARTTELIARASGDSVRARVVIDSVAATLARVRTAMATAPRVRVFWKVYDRPLLTIGRGSFMSELVAIAGGENLFDDLAAPSAAVTLEDVARRDPDLVLVAPGGEARLRASASWQAVRAVREGHLALVDTARVGRPGVRLGEAAVSLARLLHPGSAP